MGICHGKEKDFIYDDIDTSKLKLIKLIESKNIRSQRYKQRSINEIYKNEITKQNYNMCIYYNRGMNKKKQEDIEFGNNEEKINIVKLNQHFKINLHYRCAGSVLDFIDVDNKIIIELKGRRVMKNQHHDTIIGMNKIYNSIDYIKNGYTIYYAFSFIDKLCYYKFDGIINNKWNREGGRCDRGKDEYNNYYHIPIKLLIDI
jgi:very-short-patch-repair endonuclease